MRGKAPVRRFALSEKNIASVVKMSEYRRCSRSPLSSFLLRYHKDIQQEKEERGSLLVARDEAFGAPFSSVTRSENGFPPSLPDSCDCRRSSCVCVSASFFKEG